MPAPYSAGSIFLQVVPSLRGVPEQIAREAREWDLGKEFDKNVEKQLEGSIKRGVDKGAQASSDAMGKAGAEAGNKYAGKFRESMAKGVAAAQKELGALKVDVNDRAARQKLDSLRKGFANLGSDIKVGVDSGRALLAFQELEKRARDLQDKSTSLEFRANIASVVRDMETIRAGIQSLSAMDIEPELKVDRQLGLFERRLREGIRGALNDLPPITLDDSEANTKIAELRERLFELADIEIGVDVDSAVAFAELARVEGELRRIADESMSMDLRVNAAGAMKSVAAVRTELEALSRITIEPELDVDKQMGAFERGFKGALDNALRDLGSIDQKVTGTTLAERAVRDLRQRMLELGDLQIGVDISAETAREELRRIRDDLEQLQREHWSIDIDADTAAASAQISGFLAALEAVDHEDIDVEVELKGVASVIAGAAAARNAIKSVGDEAHKSGGNAQDGANSFRAFNIRMLSVAALGPLVVPALGMIGAGIAALAPLAFTGAAALGVLSLGLMGIGDAFKAMGTARTESARDLADYKKGVETASRGVADAQRTVASAHRGVEDAQRGVANAERGVADAREAAARSAESAGRAVEDALRGVEGAERQLRSAQKDAADAQRDLTRARAEAAEQLEDLQLRARGGELEQRQAAIDLREAERDLLNAQKRNVTGDDMEQFILDLDKAKLRVDQVAESNGDIALEQDKWVKGGIEGSDVVVAAHERVQSAQEGIADAERSMADAQRNLADARVEQARAAVDGQRSIADAQSGVAEAQRGVADANLAVADANRGLTEAQQAYSEAVLKTSSSQDKLRDSMAKLGPAGQAFVTFLDSLRPKFDALRSVAQAGLLPGLQEWISSMVSFHGPLLTRTVGGISRAIGDMFSAFGQSIKGPQFTALFEMINSSGPSFIAQMSKILVNLGEGIASLTVAMEPLAHLFGKWLVDATARFSQWAASLKGSTGLQEFFEWVERVGPKVGQFFLSLGAALLAIGKAIAPFAEGMVDKFTDFFDWIADFNPALLGTIVVGILTLTVALQALFGLSSLMYSFQTAANLTTGALTGLTTAGKFLGWVGLLAAAFYILYQNSDQFRAAVDDLWHNVLEPLAGMLADVLLPVLQAMTGWLGDHLELVAAMAAAWASWKIITTVIGWVGALKTALMELAVVQAATGMVGGIGGARGGIMRNPTNAARGLGGTAALAGAGGAGLAGGVAAGVVGLGVVGSVLGYKEMIAPNDKQEDKWAKAILAGGEAMAKARKEYEDSREWLSVGQWADEAVGMQASWKDAAKAASEYRANLDPLALAQSKVAEWTATLKYRQQDGNATAKEVAIAEQRVEYWTTKVGDAQGVTTSKTDGLKAASDKLTQSMLSQQSALIAVADAEIAYSQAKDDLNAVFAEYKAVMDDVNATDEDRRRAEEQWTNQSRQTAEAAKAAAIARAAGLPDMEREAAGNAALVVDLDRQKQLYGELPPRLQELRDSLALTVTPAQYLAAQFDALQLKVKEVPNNKTIILESATEAEIEKLQRLGFHVEHLPGGKVQVTAETEEARLALEELTKPRTMIITAHVTPTGVIQPGKNNDYATTPGQGSTQGGGFNAGPRATGGPIFGAGTGTSDSILARLSNGEFVVKAASVNKYGLGFLNEVNAGRYQPPGFRKGGLVDLPRFADGGFVASYGGTINLSGAQIPELASWWVAAMATINNVSNQTATNISLAFSGLRAALLGNFGQTHADVVGIWGSMFSNITGQTSLGVGGINLLFGQLRDNINGRFSETRDNAINRARELVERVTGHFNTMPGFITTPINKIIDAVLNNGLFKAFNSIVGALGLDEKIKIPTATTVKLATGGRVPGSSPHAKADNIPAWLTAGEWVQPVDSVNYYGADVMEAIRRKKIPRELLMAPINRANGGLVELGRRLQAMGAKVTEHPAFGGVAMGGHGKTSLHYSGHAIDVNTRPGTSALEQRELAPMEKLARSLGFRTIFMAPDHYNHLHVDDGGGKSILGSIGGLLGGAMDFLSDPIGMLKKAVEDGLGPDFEGGVPIRKIMASGARKMVDLMADKVTGWVSNLFTDGGDMKGGGALSGNAVANESLVQKMAAGRGWTGPEWNALRALIMKESGFNNVAQNPTSTAYGMFQFLNSTWAGTGIGKTSDARLQTEAGFRYIAGRYGTPSRALAFHRANNWYSDGGPVTPNQATDNGAIVPDLHDTGGWVMPGLNVLMNRTGRPEPVINPQTLDALLSIADRGAGGDQPLIGSLSLPMVAADPKEAVSEVMHQVRVLQTGGRY